MCNGQAVGLIGGAVLPPGPFSLGIHALIARLYNAYCVRRTGRLIVRSAKVAELVDALALGASGVTRESSSLSFRTNSSSHIGLDLPPPLRAV
jgi:hypothetical protein